MSNAIYCDVCGAVGPGTGWGLSRPRYEGLAEGWTVHREGMTGARPRCPEHSAGQATCGPVSTCRSCKWYKQYGASDTGHCHRHPPTVVMCEGFTGSYSPQSRWPLVERDDMCGEYAHVDGSAEGDVPRAKEQ